MSDSWLVLKCSACKICHGRKSIGHLCPHCGQRISANAEVVDKAFDSNELRMKVILANTPDNLKDLLKSKLSNNSPLIGKEYSSASGLNAIKDSVDESGIIHIDVVAEKLRKNSIEIDVEQFMEHIETQGLVIRIESGIWKFLE